MSAANAGHISVAIAPDRMLMNRFGPSFATMHPNDILTLDFHGNIIEDHTPQKNARLNETVELHGIIHRYNPHATCVLHTHPPATVTWSTFRKVPEIYDQESCILAGDVAVVEEDYEGLASGEERTKSAALALGKNRAVILPNHGAITTGPNVQVAVFTMILLEGMVARNLSVLSAARATGLTPQPIKMEVAQQVRIGIAKMNAHRAALGRPTSSFGCHRPGAVRVRHSRFSRARPEWCCLTTSAKARRHYLHARRLAIACCRLLRRSRLRRPAARPARSSRGTRHRPLRRPLQPPASRRRLRRRRALRRRTCSPRTTCHSSPAAPMSANTPTATSSASSTPPASCATNGSIEFAQAQHLDAIATAHTADDQAETVLMKFLRGAGTRGLAGIHPVLTRDGIRVVRPLLETPRAEIEHYLRKLDQPWREDHTNQDTQFTRNRIRHELLPLLERDYNPNRRELLGETAEVARARRTTVELDLGMPRSLARALRANASRAVARGLPERLQRRGAASDAETTSWNGTGLPPTSTTSRRLRRCALGEGGTVSLPGDWLARREWRLSECLLRPRLGPSRPSGDGSTLLPIPGEMRITGTEGDICRLPLSRLKSPPSIRPVPCFAPKVSTSSPSATGIPATAFARLTPVRKTKLKELFADKRIPADQRPLWPVVLSGTQIVWVRGLPRRPRLRLGSGLG